jgi:hypothetical protein
MLALLGAILFSIEARAQDSAAVQSAAVQPVGKATLCKRQPPRPAAPTVPKVVIAGTVERPLPDCRIPISPRAALVRSMLAPGLGQFNLLRPKAGWLFVSAEGASLAMIAKSWHDLSQAKAARRDTVVVEVKDGAGNPVIDPVTHLPQTKGEPKNTNLADRVRARRTHLEDWMAALVFNHLFSGADAWVAAQLVDFDVNVQATALDKGIQLAARISW